MTKLVQCLAGMAALFLGLLIAGCATVAPSPGEVLTEAGIVADTLAGADKADRAELAPIVAAEVHAARNCPSGLSAGLVLLNAARLSFDAFLRPRVSAASAGIVDRLRAETDRACGLTDAPGADPEPPAARPPSTPTV